MIKTTEDVLESFGKSIQKFASYCLNNIKTNIVNGVTTINHCNFEYRIEFIGTEFKKQSIENAKKFGIYDEGLKSSITFSVDVRLKDGEISEYEIIKTIEEKGKFYIQPKSDDKPLPVSHSNGVKDLKLTMTKLYDNGLSFACEMCKKASIDIQFNEYMSFTKIPHPYDQDGFKIDMDPFSAYKLFMRQFSSNYKEVTMDWKNKEDTLEAILDIFTICVANTDKQMYIDKVDVAFSSDITSLGEKDIKDIYCIISIEHSIINDHRIVFIDVYSVYDSNEMTLEKPVILSLNLGDKDHADDFIDALTVAFENAISSAYGFIKNAPVNQFLYL